MRIALAQTNPTIGDFEGNSARLLNAAREADARGADVVVFPELALCGYPPRDLVEKPSFLDRSEAELARFARATADLKISIVCGFVGRSHDETGKQALNSAAVIESGQIKFRQTKMLLPTYDVFDESRYFRPARTHRDLPASAAPSIALTICEDAWNDKQFWERRLYNARSGRRAGLRGRRNPHLCINASPYHMGKRELRRAGFPGRGQAPRHAGGLRQQVGGNDQLVFDGSSFAMNAAGDLVAAAHRSTRTW